MKKNLTECKILKKINQLENYREKKCLNLYNKCCRIHLQNEQDGTSTETRIGNQTSVRTSQGEYLKQKKNHKTNPINISFHSESIYVKNEIFNTV